MCRLRWCVLIKFQGVDRQSVNDAVAALKAIELQCASIAQLRAIDGVNGRFQGSTQLGPARYVVVGYSGE